MLKLACISGNERLFFGINLNYPNIMNIRQRLKQHLPDRRFARGVEGRLPLHAPECRRIDEVAGGPARRPLP